jgi:hypothetical protein
MNVDYQEAEEFEVEFAEGFEVEFDEIDEADASEEIAQLTAAIRGARAWH